MRLIVEGTPAELAAVRAGDLVPPEPEVVVRENPALPAGAVPVPTLPQLVAVCRHWTTGPVMRLAHPAGHHMSWYQPARAWLCIACGMPTVEHSYGQLVLAGPPGLTCQRARQWSAVEFVDRPEPGSTLLPDGRELRQLELRAAIRVHLAACAVRPGGPRG